MKGKTFKLISAVLSLLFWVLVWAVISFRVSNDFLLPSPMDTLTALGNMALTADFWTTAGISLARILIGILVAVAIGSIAAVLTASVSAADSLLSPMMTVIKATPIASFIVLALLWIDRNSLPVFITVLIVLPVIWSNVSSGIRAVDRGLLEVAKVYKFPLGKRIMRVYVPSVTPYFLAACRASLGMAWKAGIAAEVLLQPMISIGKMISDSRITLETTDLFAWTVVVVILSVLIEKLMILVFKLATKNRHTVRDGGDTNA